MTTLIKTDTKIGEGATAQAGANGVSVTIDFHAMQQNPQGGQ